MDLSLVTYSTCIIRSAYYLIGLLVDCMMARKMFYLQVVVAWEI